MYVTCLYYYEFLSKRNVPIAQELEEIEDKIYAFSVF